jgi:hypothetical protein
LLYVHGFDGQCRHTLTSQLMTSPPRQPTAEAVFTSKSNVRPLEGFQGPLIDIGSTLPCPTFIVFRGTPAELAAYVFIVWQMP